MHPQRGAFRRLLFPTKKQAPRQVKAHQAKPRSVDIVCMAEMWRLQCRTRRGWRTLAKSKGNVHSQEAPQERQIYAHRRNRHRDEHERDPAFKRKSECARNAVEPSSPEYSPESVLPALPALLGIWRKSYKAPARCTSMDDESTCTSENCKNTVNEKVINVHVPNRLCAR